MATIFPTATFLAIPPASAPAIIEAKRFPPTIAASNLVAATIGATKLVALQPMPAKLVTKKLVTKKTVARKIFLHLPIPQPTASPPGFPGEN